MTLATFITQQQWHEIGRSAEEGVKATEDKEVLIQQNFAVLERLLMKLILYRKTRSKNSSRSMANLSTVDEKSEAKRQKYEINTASGVNNDEYNQEQKVMHAKAQLHLYVRRIAELYRDVLYHNFQHATHVTLSANKLIDILLTCTYIDGSRETKHKCQPCSASPKDRTAETFERFLNTFGISEDPLIHFGLVFSALVHDVEHKGLPNAQLIKEQDKLSAIYINKSIAEQHSIAVAFSILAEPCFKELRETIWTSKHEYAKFRNLVVNLILATDISSPERTAIGRDKWNTAFAKDPELVRKSGVHRRRSEPYTRMSSILKRSKSKRSPRASETNASYCHAATSSLATLKANAIMEQLMQIADVAHLMQDWQVFVKWNKKLYDELWAANIANRGFDPSKNWFKGQISFLDNYVIPLGKRICESEIFGSQGTVFMENAIKNRDRWMVEGEQMSQKMVKNTSYILPNCKVDCEPSTITDTVVHFSSSPRRSFKSTRAA